jgi:hypothetical protein
VEPGAVKTPIWQRGAAASRSVFDGLAPEARDSYESSVANMTRLAEKMEKRGIPPEQVAEAIERALYAPRPRARYLVGADARARLFVARLPEGLRDRIVSAAIGSAKPSKPARKEVALATQPVRR